MLTELSIKDFAIIDEITITFRDGLTVLTGETGAGKSIIIDAVELLSGGRGSVEFVRYGAKKANLEGLFIIDDRSHPIFKKAKHYGIDIDEDGMIVLNRTITANGKSICRVNGNLVTLAILKEIGKTMIDIHSQHETQSLMDVERHIELLDLYKKETMDQAKEEYLVFYHQLNSLRKRYKELTENEQEMAQRLDLLQFQLNELRNAELSPDEDHLLSEERQKLINYERIYKGIQDAYNALYGEQKGLDWLSLALNGLEQASEYDDHLKEKQESLSNNFFLIEELTYDLRNYLDGLEFDPERLNYLEGRLNEINRLKKKYGQSVSEMLAYASKIEDEVDEIQNRDSHLLKLENEVFEVGNDTLLEAKQLHDLRKEAATSLIKDIHKELKDLYLEKAAFDVDISIKKGTSNDLEYDGFPVHLTPNGMDSIKFLITTNPGEPLKELNKVASGGELSRIMLALKRIFAKHQGVTSVIFDEVDTGVSGRVAQAIAEKIYGVAVGSQVLCITHLPQVASMADTHLLIEKHVSNDRTSTVVKELEQDDRIEEIGRMTTGAELTETSMSHAKELITLAEKHKTTVKNTIH
ncbi:DNA repair protein RecN [Aquibacillus koreensis]|uniref:DNA repair protein RecN n=1 Tax=Aquibacillus koreensis TaxID=279446 RepID=A0A9X3WKH0_9BACI|nr:DNA repair protein RecN [Aquibacillus koreensis]MCT2537508.1 DNA repair protein RecN [Aquibacillus koreensis]MDC3418954.1 DNA repair protein RecN [Aquibacillus koreensis]